MTALGRVFQRLRLWTGLADASESHLTPSHGWLLTAPADARQQRTDREQQRAGASGEHCSGVSF